MELLHSLKIFNHHHHHEICRERPCKLPGNTQGLAVILLYIYIWWLKFKFRINMWSSSCQSGSKWTKVRYLHTFSAPSRPSRRSTAPCPGAHESPGLYLGSQASPGISWSFGRSPLVESCWTLLNPPWFPGSFPNRKANWVAPSWKKIWFWDDFSLRQLVKWSLNQIPSKKPPRL